jgi:hypothetical protein
MEVVARLRRAAERPVLVLLLVLDLHLGVAHRDLVERDDVAVSRAARLIAGDEDVGELELQEILLPLAGLAGQQSRVREVMAVGARLHQLRRRFVDLHHEVEVLAVDFPGPVPASRVSGARVRLSPRPGLELDVILVLVVLALAVDCRDLQKIVD